MRKRARVAAVQFAVGTDVEANLAACLRMIDEAAKQTPDLVVLPEFCNHLSWYDDKAHCYRVSVALDGPFLGAIAEKARAHGIHVVVNCTVRREGGTATGTSLLYGPAGVLLGSADKQVLMGHENDFLERPTRNGPVIETAIGRIGLYACMDGVINETPRGLAVRGAQILCNSLNSFATDEGSLHVPVRGPENRVFIVAANKVGPLLPEALLGPVSAATSIPEPFLYGAGESQIVAPDGKVLARAPRTGEAVVASDIDVSLADDKRRPDGTDVFAARRPDLYGDIARAPHAKTDDAPVGAAQTKVAVFAPTVEGEVAIAEAALAVVDAAKGGASLVVLPELFCFEGAAVTGPFDAAESRSRRALEALQMAASRASKEHGAPVFVATSLPLTVKGAPRATGLLIGADGVRLEQPQVHANERHGAWSKPGDALTIASLPWAQVAVVSGDDALYPEIFRLLALRGVEVVCVPTHVQEAWEVETGLLERAAENRICLVVATRPTKAGTSLVLTLEEDFTLMTPWRTRPFDGLISFPIVRRAPPTRGLFVGEVHPARTHNKVLSHRTHVVDGRPWDLAAPLVAALENGEGQ